MKRNAAATSLTQRRCVAVFIAPHNGRTRNVLMNSSWNSDSAVQAPLRDCEMWLSCDEVERREFAFWATSRAEPGPNSKIRWGHVPRSAFEKRMSYEYIEPKN